MTHRTAALLLLATALHAQPTQPEGAPPIAAYLDAANFPPLQKEEVRKALAVRDYRTAEIALLKAINADPKSPALLTLAARVFLLDHNPANAAIALKKAERLQALADPDRFMLAIAYLGIHRGAWARPELERLAKGDPANTLYPYWLARIDYDDHLYDAAIARLRAVTKSNPQFMRAWDNLGLSLEGAGLLDEAVKSYREAVRLNREQLSHSPWPPLNLATLLTRKGELKAAEQLIREAIADQPGLADAHYRLGVNLRKQQRNPEALAELEQANRLDPSATGPLYELGQLYRQQGNQAASSKAFEAFKELKKKERGTY